MIDLSNIRFGALPSPYDPRDWPARAATPAAIPLPIKLKTPKVASQGPVGNCVAQGSTKSIELGVPGVVFVTPISSYYLDQYGVLHNDGPYSGTHLMFVAEVDNHRGGKGIEEMVRFQNSWDEDWGIDGCGWMTWTDFFRQGEVWALYPAHDTPTEFGVDFPYGRYREHRTPGMYPREAFEGMRREGIAPRRDDPDNTEVTAVIDYAKVTDAARLLKAAAPFKGINYFRLSTPDDVKAVLYEAMLLQQGEPQPKPIVIKHTTLRLKTPYMRDKDTVTGTDVTLCQQRLTLHGHPCGAIDGVFGPKCDAAAKTFQKAKGLTVDGIVGIKTWAALEAGPDNGGTYDVDAIEAMMELMVGDGYIIGAQNHELTKGYLDERRAARPGYFDTKRYEWLVARIALAAKLGRTLRCEDCSGLLMACNDILHWWPENDLDAAGIYKKCAVIARADLRPGDILVRAEGGEIVHMAWVGRKGIYEAAGIAYGVVFRTSADDRATLNRITGKIDTLEPWTGCARPLESIYANP